MNVSAIILILILFAFLMGFVSQSKFDYFPFVLIIAVIAIFSMVNFYDVESIEILGFINRADTHIGVRETGEAEEALQLLPNIQALDTRLYQRTAYRRSFSEGLAVFEQDPMGKAAREMKKLAKLLYK